MRLTASPIAALWKIFPISDADECFSARASRSEVLMKHFRKDPAVSVFTNCIFMAWGLSPKEMGNCLNGTPKWVMSMIR